jgi:hypothetical protein
MDGVGQIFRPLNPDPFLGDAHLKVFVLEFCSGAFGKSQYSVADLQQFEACALKPLALA